MSKAPDSQAELILAAEDCPPNSFDDLHKFPTRDDKRILLSLTAHGPVLLRGGRGTGKSALMIAASRKLYPVVKRSTAIGIYMSLRHAPLLKSTGSQYGMLLCQIVINAVKERLGKKASQFNPTPDVGAVQTSLLELSKKLEKRIVLFFDDAAHLGREASLEEFFDIYRTLSSNSVSCKAAIYPGVTRFGIRFDVYNDSTVIDLLRSEELPGFTDCFTEIMTARYPHLSNERLFARVLSKPAAAQFLAQSVLGNMRGFVFACNALSAECEDGRTIGLTELGNVLLRLASNYYWPLLDEIEPKIGKYQPMVNVSRHIAELAYEEAGGKPKSPRDFSVHREVDERLSRPLQILEYAGFISKREASRAMKSGGRGPRYALNLCNLLEKIPQARLTRELFEQWTTASREESVQYNKASKLATIDLPVLSDSTDLAIFKESISKLEKSNAYPYGLTDQKITVLKDAGISTVGDLADISDVDLDQIPSIGPAMVKRIRNVLGQAIWM